MPETPDADAEKAKRHLELAGKLEAIARDEKNDATERLSASLKALTHVSRYHTALLQLPGIRPDAGTREIVDQLVKEKLIAAAGTQGMLSLRQRQLDRASATVLITWTFGIGLALDGWARLIHYGFLLSIVGVSTWLSLKIVRKAKASA
jgi:hypothetical protein